MKLCVSHNWTFFLIIFTVLLQNTYSTHGFSKKEFIPAPLKSTIISSIQNSNSVPLTSRPKREEDCDTTSRSPVLEPELNALAEEKDHIRMRWLDGDRVILIASDQSFSLHASTSVWIIDVTNPDSIVSTNQSQWIKQSILTVVVNPLDKSNAILIATDLRTLYILHSASWTVKTFPSELSISLNSLLNDDDLQTLLFHPSEANYVMIACGGHIYYSKDSGYEWHEGPSDIISFQWGQNATVFYGMQSQSLYYPLYRTDDLFATNKQIQPHVVSYYFEKKVLFVSKQNENDPTNSTRRIWVSSDYGDTFNLAHIPEASPEQFYGVTVVTESYAMLHLGNSSSVSGQLFISDSKFVSYTLSLNDHLSQLFYQVQSIRGVYIASIPVSRHSNKVRTLITYNAGGDWMPIPYSSCPSGKPNCHLNLYVSDVLDKNVLDAQSYTNAKGLILAYGVIGDTLDLADTSSLQLFMSTDGGYQWAESLDSEYQVVVGNYGNLMVGVRPYLNNGSCLSISKIRFAHSQGECWADINRHTLDDFKYCGVNMEPQASSLRVFFWGVEGDSNKWSFLVIDFQKAFDRVCGEDDFESFIPHVATGCLLGYNETFQRVKADSICYIGTNKAKLSDVITNSCQCRKNFDFECDFGYERQPDANTSCLPIPDYDVSQHCSQGEVTYNFNPFGLRLIAGDKCTGMDSIIHETTMPCNGWDINSIINYLNSHQTGSLVAGIFVLFLVFLCIFLASYFVFRVWLRKSTTKEVFAYKSLLNAANDEESSLGESDAEGKEVAIEKNDDEPIEL